MDARDVRTEEKTRFYRRIIFGSGGCCIFWKIICFFFFEDHFLFLWFRSMLNFISDERPGEEAFRKNVIIFKKQKKYNL